jgi:hypothetical protein
MAQRPDDGVSSTGDQARTDGAATAGEGTPESATEDAARRAEQKRHRLAEIFGDVLPDTTADERPGDSSGGEGDDHLRREVPPHHG